MCNWSWTWFKPEGSRSAEQIAEEFCRTLIGGLAAGTPAPTDPDALAEAVLAAMAAHESEGRAASG
jgi:hypothetical protein